MPGIGGPGRGTDPPRRDPWQAGLPGDEARAARLALAERLRFSAAVSEAVHGAFRRVPRHLFLPELPPASAYADEAIVIKTAADGTPVSSSSQPTMMALMLEQLAVRPGHRVLEIGTGTGYNAALLACLTGADGLVVSVDIDPELTARATASLAAAGYGCVLVMDGDGGLGYPARAPYDRIVVTAGADDLSPCWLEQLRPGGRLVLPLSVRGIQLSVALSQGAGHWASTSAIRCGFVRMAGAMAAGGPHPASPLAGWRVDSDEGRPVDTAALRAALSGQPMDVAATVPPVSQRELSDADIWLTLTEPEMIRVSAAGPERVPGGALRSLGGLAGRPGAAGELGVAVVVPGPSRGTLAPLVVRGYGPGGAALAGYLANQLLAWHRLGRPGLSGLRLRAYPPGTRPARPGELLLPRRHVVLGAGWD